MTTNRILLVSHGEGFYGGAEFVFAEAASALSDCDVLAVAPGQGPLLERLATAGIATATVPLPRWGIFHEPWLRFNARVRVRMTVRLILAVVDAVRFLRLHRPDLVVTNTMAIPSFAIAARVTRTRHIWMVQELAESAHDVRLLLGPRFTVRLIASLSDKVICPSHAVEESLRSVVPSARTVVVYPPVDGPSMSHRRRTSQQLRAVLLSRFSRAKGQSLAIDALARARAQGADVILTLIGALDENARLAMEAVADAAGVSDYVTCRPFTHSPDEAWRDADVALTCSRDEAFGRVTIEAMRAGLPVCGADSGATPELVIDGVNGFLFPADDPQGLASCLVLLAGDEPLRERLAMAATQTASRFTASRYALELRHALLSCS